MLNINEISPNFTLISHGFTLHELRNRKIVLFFYPKDNTTGCTKEVCNFQAKLTEFTAYNTEIIGISGDSIKSHEQFKNKYNISFTLLSDPTKFVCELYNTYTEKTMYGRKYMGIERTTFLIDNKKIIRNIWRNVKISGHIDEVLLATSQLID